MATLRILAEDDVPAVVELFGRVYPEHRWASQAACESYFREMLFDNPWRDPELPSWVAEEDGRIAGFQAVLPRRMLSSDLRSASPWAASSWWTRIGATASRRYS